MKLMIDIPYEAYHTFKCDLGKGNLNALAEIVANGTPITDDMISRSALREEISNAFIDGAKKSIFKKYIDNAPAIGGSK